MPAMQLPWGQKLHANLKGFQVGRQRILRGAREPHGAMHKPHNKRCLAAAAAAHHMHEGCADEHLIGAPHVRCLARCNAQACQQLLLAGCKRRPIKCTKAVLVYILFVLPMRVAPQRAMHKPANNSCLLAASDGQSHARKPCCCTFYWCSQHCRRFCITRCCSQSSGSRAGLLPYAL